MKQYARISGIALIVGASISAQAQMTAIITAVGSTADAFGVSPSLPAQSTTAALGGIAVVNYPDNITSMSRKGAPVVSVRATRPLNAANRPTTGYIIIHQKAQTNAYVVLNNIGSGKGKAHSYDLESSAWASRPSNPGDKPGDYKASGETWNYRKKVTGLTWTPNLNIGFDDYEWSQAFTISLPHTLSGSAKVSGPRSGDEGNYAVGIAGVTLSAEFVKNLPSAKISVNLSGASLNNRSILCDVTTLATDGIEYLVPDTDNGITLIALADESSLANVRVWVTGSLKRSATTTIDDGSDTSITVTPIFGDINGDNVINSADETLMNERIANGANDVFLPDDYYDYNQDGLVNSADLLILQGNLNIVGD